MGAVRFVYLLALGLWIGEIVFFSFIVAPAIFRALGAPQAGEVVASIFPRYYALGIACGAIAVGSAIVLGRRAAQTGPWTAVTLVLAVALAATLWARIGVYPRARGLRVTMQSAGAAPEVAEEFHRLHRRAVVLNVATLLGALAGLGLSAGTLRS